MRKVWAVVRREFVERVRTRQFVIGTLLGPLLLGLAFVAPILLQRSGRVKRVAVLDGGTGLLGQRIEAALRDATRGGEETDSEARYQVTRVLSRGRLDPVRDSLLSLVGRKDLGEASLDGVLLVTDDVVTRDTIVYYGANVGSPADMSRLSRTIRQAVMLEKLSDARIEPAVLGRVVKPIELMTSRVSQGRVTGESGEASFALAYVMAMVLYMALILYGMQVMTSTVEEKTSRINEILVSSLKPFELLLGKVVGVGSVGLFQLGIYGVVAWLLASNRVWLAERFGATPAAAASVPIPEIPMALLVVFLVFFVLGFFFYAAAYAAVGSTCSTVQETQQAQMPVTLLLVAGLLVMFGLLDDPNGRLAEILTLVPPLAPIVTPVRQALSPLPLAELLLSIGVTALGVLAMAWIAGRIYRTGILMYGKRASMREVFRWVRVG